MRSIQLFLAAAAFVTSTALGRDVRSVYVDTSHCTEISKNTETGASHSKCGDMDGYSLFLDVDDDRSSFSVKFGSEMTPLRFDETVTNRFNVVGKKVEWRVENQNGKETPYALIARVLWNTDDPSSKGQYLVVSRIRKTKSCVIAKIDAGTKDANQAARKIADESSDQSRCL